MANRIERLSPSEGHRLCTHLSRGLRALRLNLYYPGWRMLSDHLIGVGHIPPSQDGFSLCPRTGWPHPEEWLRFRIDHSLAPDLLPRIARAEATGDVPSVHKADYLRHILEIEPLQTPPIHVSLVAIEDGPDGPQGRFEVVIDRLEPAEPSFVRWTLRVLDLDIGDRIHVHELEARATDAFERRLQVLAAQPALAAWLVLWEDEEVRVEEVVRGEIGPVVHHAEGPCLSATLTRIANHLSGIRVDDPLVPDLLIPETDTGDIPRYGMSHSRKWAIPEAASDAHRAWLLSEGSKNLVYTFKT